ncbi:SAV0927 family protein [Marininema halotolerans]|uniref:DUF3055 domain-containing protein n=1 Tax=Marininema halotolerans TaxID=1155944 RepID=A0A1I6TTZ9_9BACL|nr:SAV0927 family protein [Marininema halotolerans]SFS92568.1 Protein of unknown function [Marininema halotolerans]
MALDYLLDETEKPVVRHVCLAAKVNRYDFSLIYTHKFYGGKTMVACLQSGKLLLMDKDDLLTGDWVEKLGVEKDDVEVLKAFLDSALDEEMMRQEY